MTRVARALISVSDKTGITEFAAALAQLGIEIVSTGGTATALRKHGLAVRDVAELTGFPEIMDGRVKTLHPKVHGGLLGRRDVDAAVMAEHGIDGIELLVVNLYPFEATAARSDCTREDAIENIDIGGPAMIRAAAKNHAFVAVVVDPSDYASVLDALRSPGRSLDEATRRRLARKAFAHTAHYDATISGYLESTEGDGSLPAKLTVPLTRQADMRYGENPHQRAALYRLPRRPAGTLIDAQLRQGKALSFNNIADADAALECARALPSPACVIVKHANPCGVGVAPTLLECYEKAYVTDPESAFGGVIACNVEVDGRFAGTLLARQFLEVIVAPSFSADALAAFAKKPNVRVLATGPLADPATPSLRLQQIEGGLLVQYKDVAMAQDGDLRVVTKRQPTARERADAAFAWRVIRFVKSNAIIYCRDGATLGIGAGQMSRVMSARIAAWKAGEAKLDIRGAAMASDAFFPFRDGIDTAAKHGISIVIQPGGSMRDEEVIAAADEHGMAMLFTGVRHFRH
ncbi:MAG: bifunctional phosphoribosylaminoimidazolecarboxamide formyltransferase/IMP cyclohydrolase [Gammaproteobacteria bacterium]|nr:bifunctional phosphoribosylaminoimidazolecarboxamide formyltransferase/IMP cyclohydrolase [Gammaproteobacteria bacterium]